MAKTKTAKKVEKETVKSVALLRKGALAYIGLYGAAYERAKFRFEQVRGGADGLFERLVVKGEEIEGKATVCLLYTSPSPRDKRQSRMPSSA